MSSAWRVRTRTESSGSRPACVEVDVRHLHLTIGSFCLTARLDPNPTANPTASRGSVGRVRCAGCFAATTALGVVAVSSRLQVVLPDPVVTQLHRLAAGAGEPPSTLAGQMVRSGVAEASTRGNVRPLRRSRHAVSVDAAGERPRWLEPYGGDHSWRRVMWGAIVALHGRYPGRLAPLRDGWWNDDAEAEILCALAIWRADIDDGGEDPREELAFHERLRDYSHALRHQGGGIATAWQPGAPPREWA
jgi:hypothetical protein